MSVILTRVFGCTIGFVITLVLMSSCIPFKTWNTTPTPKPISSPGYSSTALMRLLIGKTDLPPYDWFLEVKPHQWPEDYGQDSSVYVGFNTDAYYVPVIHAIFLFESEPTASVEFGQCSQAFFDSAGRLTKWAHPVQLDFQSDRADEYQLACADFESLDSRKNRYTDCVAVVRYEEYISMLSADVTDHYEGALSYSEFENVLKTIDERMQDFLDVADGDQPKNE